MFPNFMNNGVNPQMLLNRLRNDQSIMSNQKAREIMRMHDEHDTTGIESFINNMASEYGTDYNNVRKQFMDMFKIK